MNKPQYNPAILVLFKYLDTSLWLEVFMNIQFHNNVTKLHKTLDLSFSGTDLICRKLRKSGLIRSIKQGRTRSFEYTQAGIRFLKFLESYTN